MGMEKVGGEYEMLASQEPVEDSVGVTVALLIWRAVALDGTPMISILVVALKSTARERVPLDRDAVRTRYGPLTITALSDDRSGTQ